MSTDTASKKEDRLLEKHSEVELTEKPLDIDKEAKNSPIEAVRMGMSCLEWKWSVVVAVCFN